MINKPLGSLLRLRKQEQTEAERHFAVVLASEAQATHGVAEAEKALICEQRRAADPDCDDIVVESFARWLPQGRAALRRAQERAREASLDTAYARSALAMAQASLKAVETIIAERERNQKVTNARYEQRQLDDLSLTRNAI